MGHWREGGTRCSDMRDVGDECWYEGRCSRVEMGLHGWEFCGTEGRLGNLFILVLGDAVRIALAVYEGQQGRWRPLVHLGSKRGQYREGHWRMYNRRDPETGLSHWTTYLFSSNNGPLLLILHEYSQTERQVALKTGHGRSSKHQSTTKNRPNKCIMNT